FADPIVGGVTADLLYAAEEGVARDTAETLISDVGLEPVWVGGIDAFDIVDSVTRLWFALALQRKLGRRPPFNVLPASSPPAAGPLMRIPVGRMGGIGPWTGPEAQ